MLYHASLETNITPKGLHSQTVLVILITFVNLDLHTGFIPLVSAEDAPTVFTFYCVEALDTGYPQCAQGRLTRLCGCWHVMSKCIISHVNACHAEYIMPHPLLISSQSDYLIRVFDTNSHI